MEIGKHIDRKHYFLKLSYEYLFNIMHCHLFAINKPMDTRRLFFGNLHIFWYSSSETKNLRKVALISLAFKKFE